MKTTDGRRTCRAGGHYACGQGGAVAAVVTYGTRPGADGEAKATATTTTTMKPVDREPIVIRSLSAVCRMLVIGKSDNAVFGSIRLMYSSLSSGDLSIRRSRSMLRPMSHLRAILSRNFVARQNRECDMACRATSQQSRNSFSDYSSDLFCATLSRKCGER